MSPAFVAPNESLNPRTFVCAGIPAKSKAVPAVPCGFVLELALAPGASLPTVKKVRPCPLCGALDSFTEVERRFGTD